MADAPDTSSYILTNPDGNLPNSAVLLGGLGVQVNKSGATVTVTADGNLESLANISLAGYVTYDGTDIAQRSITAGTGIAVTNPTGAAGDTQVSVVANSTTQLINTYSNTTLVSTQPSLSFTGAGGISVNISNDGANNRTNIEVAGNEDTLAPNDATYILKTPNGELSNAQALSALSTGIMKVTTTTGVVSTAVSNTDYQAANANLIGISAISPVIGTQIVGTGNSSEFAGVPPSSTPGTVWTSNGSAAIPSWQAPATGNLTVVVPAGTLAQAMAGNTTYIAQSTTTKTIFTLPSVATAVPGNFYEVVGAGVVGWTINTNATQSIAMGTVTGTTSATSQTTGANANDSITLRCVTTTLFVVSEVIGTVNIT